jgi:hypothetical protein
LFVAGILDELKVCFSCGYEVCLSCWYVFLLSVPCILESNTVDVTSTVCRVITD